MDPASQGGSHGSELKPSSLNLNLDSPSHFLSMAVLVSGVRWQPSHSCRHPLWWRPILGSHTLEGPWIRKKSTMMDRNTSRFANAFWETDRSFTKSYVVLYFISLHLVISVSFHLRWCRVPLWDQVSWSLLISNLQCRSVGSLQFYLTVFLIYFLQDLNQNWNFPLCKRLAFKRLIYKRNWWYVDERLQLTVKKCLPGGM